MRRNRNGRGPMSPEAQVAIVTGAGTGIGRAIAERLARDGWNLVLVGRRAHLLEQTRGVCSEAGSVVVALPRDVTERSSADEVTTVALDAFGRIDALVNNAGLARFARIEDATLSDLDRMFSVNVFAPVALIRAAIPALRESRGSVVNVSSIGGLVAMPGRALYGATKAALNHLTRSLARELAPS